MVPENLYKANDETFQRVVVAASSMHVHRQVVDQAGTTLVWDFYTEDADVSFGVFHVPAGTEEHERDKHRPLVPLERVNAHTDRCVSPPAGKRVDGVCAASDHERRGGPAGSRRRWRPAAWLATSSWRIRESTTSCGTIRIRG